MDLLSRASPVEFLSKFRQLLLEAQDFPLNDLVDLINEMREEIHAISPFKAEPVDFVKWVKNTSVYQNDYNPNSVAPPEMELLRLSISADGYTQPIVSMPDAEGYEVVDGFHRHRVGKECQEITERIKGYLPVVQIKSERRDKTDRMAATVRHNRARGKHKVEAMSDMVIELKRRNWSNEKIAKELGMEADEVLRLCQITGLKELFSDVEFSKSWDIEGFVTQEELKAIDDDVENYEEEVLKTKTQNLEGRIFHTFDQWECYKAGFYNTTVEGLTKEECQIKYKEFLINESEFEAALDFIINNWKNSCEHYLTNNTMNRIAWLGQAAACHAIKIPSSFRSGFFLLTEQEQEKANNTALKYLNLWLKNNDLPEVNMEQALATGRQSVIY